MTSSDQLPLKWSVQFGLAVSPLFEEGEVNDPAAHSVFLDGGHGTFAVSARDEHDSSVGAEWAWSSDIAHHIALTPSTVNVVRWDSPNDVTILNRASVERNIDDFYNFLRSDKVATNRTVVSHLLNFFRRIRSLTADARVPDDRSTDIFLQCLGSLIAPDVNPNEFGIAPDARDLCTELSTYGVEAAINDVQRSAGAIGGLRLHPALSVRHAGGPLFQEAHFELIRAPSIDLFGHIGAPEVVEVGRGGAHFTPPALARSITESVVAQLDSIAMQPRLTVCDPACGSGVFLHEALRTLRRSGFSGQLILEGRDVSASAISMARFVLSCAVRDWTPKGGVKINLQVMDSLEDGAIPESDIILMNPPFISWSRQNKRQRSQLIKIVGKSASSRGDLSMAFVARALEALKPTGVLGALFPASLLSQGAAETWRKELLERSSVRFLGSMGDYGLFTQALVQVACGVFAKGTSEDKDITALVAGDDTSATGDALRTLRKISSRPPALPIGGDNWSVFGLSTSDLKARSTWRLRAPAVENSLRKLEDALPSLGDLFDVRQGVQTGYNPAFVLKQEEWMALPSAERSYFKRATMTDSISNGCVIRLYYLFFPHTPNGPLFSDERQVKKAVPRYYEKFLEPNKARLSSRASIIRSGRTDWWGLMEPRSWSADPTPRIISKYFSGEGGFFADLDASYVPSTGFAWFAKPNVTDGLTDDFPLAHILQAYAELFNSEDFSRTLQYYSPHVSGGQYDLSPRFVNRVPLPNLTELIVDPKRGEAIRELVRLAQADLRSGTAIQSQLDILIRDLYGSEILKQLD